MSVAVVVVDIALVLIFICGSGGLPYGKLAGVGTWVVGWLVGSLAFSSTVMMSEIIVGGSWRRIINSGLYPPSLVRRSLAGCCSPSTVGKSDLLLAS